MAHFGESFFHVMINKGNIVENSELLMEEIGFLKVTTESPKCFNETFLIFVKIYR